MKIVYIAHPISGDVENNLKDIVRIVRKINLDYSNITPLVPYYVDCLALDDSIESERNRGIMNDIRILQKKLIDEVWLTGDRISSGMQQEKLLAEALGIPVINKIGEL